MKFTTKLRKIEINEKKIISVIQNKGIFKGEYSRDQRVKERIHTGNKRQVAIEHRQRIFVDEKSLQGGLGLWVYTSHEMLLTQNSDDDF